MKLTVEIEADLLDHGLSAKEIANVTTLTDEYEKSIQDVDTSGYYCN